MTDFTDNLPEALGRDVDIVPYVNGESMAYIHMEGLLTARTIWGENSWLEANQVNAEHFLRQGHERMIEASEMMSGLRETVLLSRARVVNYYYFRH